MNFLERRNSVVPFKQSRRDTDSPDGVLIQFPDWIDDRMVVCIENVFREFGVPGNMDLRHPLDRDAVEVLVGIKIVILGGHVNVIYVQENSAVGALDDLIEKLPFRHLGNVKLSVTTYVFDGDRYFQIIAGLA